MLENLDIDGFMEYLLSLSNEYVHKFDTVEDAYSYYIHAIVPLKDDAK